jgi:hypothetical protein
MVPVERDAGARINSNIWKNDNFTPINKAQFSALTIAPKLQRNKIGGRIIRIQAIVNVPKPMASNNRDFLYYFNGLDAVENNGRIVTPDLRGKRVLKLPHGR